MVLAAFKGLPADGSRPQFLVGCWLEQLSILYCVGVMGSGSSGPGLLVLMLFVGSFVTIGLGHSFPRSKQA